MKQDGSIVLFQYWNSLRRGRPAPLRTEIEPAAIKTALADTFILERGVDDHAAFRLAGTRLCAMYGRELRGLPLATLWRRHDRPSIETQAKAVLEKGTIVTIAFDGISRSGRSNPFELIMLPLESGPGDPRGIGAVSAIRRPFWLGTDPIVESMAVSIRVINPDREKPSPRSRTAVDVPELSPRELPATEDEALPIGSRRIRHLFVVEGGRSERS